MSEEFLSKLFSLKGQVAVVTGGAGVLGSAMSLGLAQAGAKVAIMGRSRDKAEATVEKIKKSGGEAMTLPADVLNKGQLEAARDTLLKTWGKPDILINAAGGNNPLATVHPDQTIFDVPLSAFQEVLNLNLLGTLLPSQIFGALMVQGKEAKGCIVNLSSMAGQRPLTRVVGYAAAKAGVENFTRWLAVELAQKYGQGIRVNALAPGFFIGDQNRKLLLNDDNSLTQRGKTIIAHTPAGRFGEAEELVSALVWLCGPGAAFINGIVVPVDGGFSAFSGV